MSPCPASSQPHPLTVALLTPVASGGIAVLRLAGGPCADIMKRVCRCAHSESPPQFINGHLTYCRLMDGAEPLDDAIVALDSGDRVPVAEICLHGGVRIVQRAIMLFERHGAVRVDAECFPRHSGGQINVAADVEAVLPRARTRRFARWLLHQRIILPAFLERLAGRRPPAVEAPERAAFLQRSAAACRLVRGLRIALVGPPNAGKSTLANALIGHDRVITSDQPGTTRDWVDEVVNIDGWPATLTDTAGMRTTHDFLEAAAIARGVEQAYGADLVVAVFDVREVAANAAHVGDFLSSLDRQRPAPIPDQAVCPTASIMDRAAGRLHTVGSDPAGDDDFTPEARIELVQTGKGRPLVLTVYNKSDLLDSPFDCAEGDRRLAISARTGNGLEELERRLVEELGIDLLSGDLPAAFLASHLLRLAVPG